MYIYTHIYTSIYIYIYIYLYIYINNCELVCVCIYTHVCIYIRIHWYALSRGSTHFKNSRLRLSHSRAISRFRSHSRSRSCAHACIFSLLFILHRHHSSVVLRVLIGRGSVFSALSLARTTRGTLWRSYQVANFGY